MDVRCGRCGTEYEFDDALISERGTTVKCTNCGHQFRIFPATNVQVAPERWVVRTVQGRELVFTSLRDLQRGIAQRQVGPSDLLSRGNQPARPLGSIAELEPFFRAGESGAGKVASVRAPAPGYFEQRPEVGSGERDDSFGRSFEAQANAPSSRPGAPMFPHQQTLRPGTWNPPRAGSVPYARDREYSASQGRAPEPEAPAWRPEPEPAWRPEPAPWRSEMHSGRPSDSGLQFQSDAEIPGLSQRRTLALWIFAAAAVVIVALLAVTLGKNVWQRVTAGPQSDENGALDARVPSLLSNGERLAAAGDYDASKDELEKAAMLAPDNPAVRRARARIAVLRADLSWFELRLLPADAADARRKAQKELEQRVGSAHELVERALAILPGDPALTRLRVDQLRIAGELDRARVEAKALRGSDKEPDSAYVLAMIDLSRTDAEFAPIIDQLRRAAVSPSEAERARSALVYALARSGAVAQAQEELANLLREPRDHPLSMALADFIGRSEAPPAASAEPEAPAIAQNSSAGRTAAVGRAAPQPAAALPGDFRAQLEQAQRAAAAGDLARAEKLYNAVLVKHPGDTEALAGLGDIAQKRKDTSTAEQLYARVLQNNPSYLPALMASADQKWERGDRAGAIALYHRVLEQTDPNSVYGQRATARIALGAEAPSAAPSAGSTSAPEQSAAPDKSAAPEPSAAPPPEKPPQDTPQIDRSDLPPQTP